MTEINRTRDIETRHRDIQFGNTFRVEYIKTLLALSSAILTFTVTFLKDFVGGVTSVTSWKLALLSGWLLLLVSTVAGVQNLRYWAWYFISWGRSRTSDQENDWRDKVSKQRKFVEQVQIYAYIFGMTMLVVFAIKNAV